MNVFRRKRALSLFGYKHREGAASAYRNGEQRSKQSVINDMAPRRVGTERSGATWLAAMNVIAHGARWKRRNGNGFWSRSGIVARK
jgi:hypothetical protein